jgi:hypothetical protein
MAAGSMRSPGCARKRPHDRRPASALTNACALLSKEGVGANSMRKLLAASCGTAFAAARSILGRCRCLRSIRHRQPGRFFRLPDIRPLPWSSIPAPIDGRCCSERLRSSDASECFSASFGRCSRSASTRLVQIGRLWRRRLFGTEPALADLPKQPGAGEILGIVDDLSVPTLVQAYQAGLFPHSHIGDRNGSRRRSAVSCSSKTSTSRSGSGA